MPFTFPHSHTEPYLRLKPQPHDLTPILPSLRSAAGTARAPTVLPVSSSPNNLRINQNGSSQTYVAIHLTSDFTGQIDVNPGVHVQFFIDGNVSVKARDIVNETGLAGNMQFYSISPTEDRPNILKRSPLRRREILWRRLYAPSADVYHSREIPDMTGAVVAKIVLR